jgi:hypothetical protein
VGALREERIGARGIIAHRLGKSVPQRHLRFDNAQLRLQGSDPPATFSVTNLRALSGRTCPRPDQAFLQRLIDYGIASGYLRGRTVQRTSG